MNFPRADHSEWSELQKFTNFDFCPLFAWMSNFGDPLFPFISWFGQLFFVWPKFLNLANPNFSIRTFTGRARHFAYGETVREAPLVTTGKIQKGTLSVPTFLSPHVSQFPRFHMSGQTTWQITYESLLGKMLRLRNSCLWICSVTNKQTWGTPDSDYISNSQERKSHTENKRFFYFLGWPPPLPLPRRPIEQTQIYFFLSWSFLHLCSVLVLVSCYFSCFCGYLICLPDASW